MTDWVVGIDVGTTTTAAAVRAGGEDAGMVRLDGSDRMSSSVLLDEDRHVLVGRAATDQAALFPDRFERTPKAYLGKSHPMMLGGQPLRAEDAIGAIISTVLAEASRLHGGQPPGEVRLTHPARWREVRLGALRRAAAVASVTNPVLIAEPVAAAMFYAANRVAVGGSVAVYDLGGGTFDTAVLERTEAGFELKGAAGREDIGGDDFDHRVFRLIGETIGAADPTGWARVESGMEPDDRRDREELLRAARELKEVLSRAPAHRIYVRSLGRDVRVTREEFEGLVHDDIEGTVVELEDTIRRAGVDPRELVAVYRVGGSSRIPLVGQLLNDRFGAISTTWDDPKTVVALGAVAATVPSAARTARSRRSEVKTSERARPEEEKQATTATQPSGRRRSSRAASSGGTPTPPTTTQPAPETPARKVSNTNVPYVGWTEQPSEPSSRLVRIGVGAGLGLVAAFVISMVINADDPTFLGVAAFTVFVGAAIGELRSYIERQERSGS